MSDQIERSTGSLGPLWKRGGWIKVYLMHLALIVVVVLLSSMRWGGVSVGGGSSLSEISARAFRLVSDDGRVVAALGQTGDEAGVYGLSLFDKAGVTRCSLRIARDGTPQLRLFDEFGMLWLSAMEDERKAGLTVLGGDGFANASMYVSRSEESMNTGAMSITGPNGAPVRVWRLDSDSGAVKPR